MSGSGRKRSSKWDSGDDPEFAPDSKHLRGGWSSSDVSGSNNSKRYVEGNGKSKQSMGKEPFSGGRGSYKDDIMNKDYRDLDAKMEWEADASYSKKISPGFEEWKHKRHSQSPKNGRSRSGRSSRSRSPAHGFRLDSGLSDRNRMRAGGSTHTCKDFAAGKCRRGSDCHFLHHDDQNFEDSWESKNREDGAPRYSAPHESRDHSLRSGRSGGACIHFAKGRCRMGTSCKYEHHNNSDGYGKSTVDELTRERENDGRRRDNSFELAGGHNRSGDTICKFFANGNCRNGKYCRFSHDQQASRSPNRRLRVDSWGRNQGGEHQTLDRPKLSDSVSPNGRRRSDRWGTDAVMAEVDKAWQSPKQNDILAVPDSVKLVEEKSRNTGITEPGLTGWPAKDGWGHSLDKSRVPGEPPFSCDKKEADQCIAENAGINMSVSQSIGTDIWPGDAEMSPDWNYRVGSSSRMEEKHGKNNHGLTQGGTYLATAELDKVQATPGQGLNQNVQDINALHSSSFHSVGQSQATVPVLLSRAGTVEGMQNQEVFAEKMYVAEPNIIDAGSSQTSSRNLTGEDTVSKEQLAQLTNLSASLAHILGSGQQLPQLYAALNSHNSKETPSLAPTEVPIMPLSNTFVKQDPAGGLSKQYDPMCDSIELKESDASGVRPDLSPSKNVAEAVETPAPLPNTVTQNYGDSFKAACSEEQVVKGEHKIQMQPGQNIENKEVVAEERQNSHHDHKKNTKQNGPLENMNQNMNQNGVSDEAKKTKDVKGIRAFKFSLVEFVKELLKPTWKEGQITKEDYKTIVKKVVDKVTGTMQGGQIPQTQERIDHYLSFSKPKLNKLVQAYVEKVQKT